MFFKTLANRIDKEIKESLYDNDNFIGYRWNFLEKSVVLWSAFYKKYIFLTLILAFFIAFNVVMWQPIVKGYALQFLPKWRILLEWQGTFLGGQLTIIGVVYPLVVGLTGVLLQNKSAKKIIFPIYQRYSGFMFAGLSGLGLSIFILFGYFLRPLLNDSIYVAICIASAFWLFGNILLTAWFFDKTFLMLKESYREEVVFRFAMNEECEIDIRSRIENIFLDGAVHFGLVSGSNAIFLEVRDFLYFDDETDEIIVLSGQGKVLKNVRFWLINFAIKIQTLILKRKGIKGCKLQIRPLRRDGEILSIAKFEGFEINSFVKLLIKLSFNFGEDKFKYSIGLSAVLNGFTGSASDALRAGDSREFSDSTRNLILWHTKLAEALSFVNDTGEMDSWLQLPNSSFWSRSYLDELLGEYFRLAKEAVERIPETSSFYKDLLYLHKKIYTNQSTTTEKEMRALIQGSYYMWYLLVEWRSYNSGAADLRVANKYEDIIYDFVGAWESWLTYIRSKPKKSGIVTKEISALLTHLEFTATTAISALRFNNFEAAGWGVDMLVNWLENFSSDDFWDIEYQWRSMLVNPNCLSAEINENVWTPILRGNSYNHASAVTVAFKNAHFDLRLITACYMLLKPEKNSRDILIRYVKALLSGTRIHSSGTIDQALPEIGSAGDLVGCYIRQRDYRRKNTTAYEGWLSSILNSFGRIYEERRVSGRIYSGWGADSLQSMSRAYIEIGISMSEKKWSLPSAWEEAILSDAFNNTERHSIVADLREWIKIAQESHDYILVEPTQLDLFKENFISSVECVIEKILHAQNDMVAKAALDMDVLADLGANSSLAFIGAARSKYPIVLFSSLNDSAALRDDSRRQINVLDYAKEGLVQGIFPRHSNSEGEWLSNYVSNNFKLNILKELLKYTPSDCYRYKDESNLLKNVISLSEALACPILFVGNQALSGLLHRSSYERELAEKYNIHRQDGFGKDYICHVGSCKVYALRFTNIDYCLLTSEELFDVLHLSQIGNGQFVKVDFELNEGSETIGKLMLQYWMKVDFLENYKCFKLELK